MAKKGLQTKIVSVDGEKYSITECPASMGIDLQNKYLALLAPILDGGNGDIIKGLGMLLKNLGSQKMSAVCLELLSYTKHQDPDEYQKMYEIDKDYFDVLFAGRYEHLYKLIYEVLKVNSFFGISSIMPMIIEKVRKMGLMEKLMKNLKKN